MEVKETRLMDNICPLFNQTVYPMSTMNTN